MYLATHRIPSMNLGESKVHSSLTA